MSSTVLQSMVVCCESPGCLVTTEEARSDRPVFILRPRHPPATSGHGTVQMPGMINIPVGFSLGFNNQYSTQKLLLPSARTGSFIHVVVMFTFTACKISTKLLLNLNCPLGLPRPMIWTSSWWCFARVVS